MVTFNLPTNLHLFVSISTCSIHSIINILVKKPFSFWGEIPNKVYLGGGGEIDQMVPIIVYNIIAIIVTYNYFLIPLPGVAVLLGD